MKHHGNAPKGGNAPEAVGNRVLGKPISPDLLKRYENTYGKDISKARNNLNKLAKKGKVTAKTKSDILSALNENDSAVTDAISTISDAESEINKGTGGIKTALGKVPARNTIE